GDRGVVDLGGPGAGVAGAVGEGADRVAGVLADGPAGGDGFVLAGLGGGGGGGGPGGAHPGGGGEGGAGGRRGRARGGGGAGRRGPGGGRGVKMWLWACSGSGGAICASSALIWVLRVASTAARALVTRALAAPASPVAPRGAAISR